MIAKSKVVFWMLISVTYVSILFYITFALVINNRSRINETSRVIELILEKKEHHIAVSEDNNRLLREIHEEVSRCCDGKGIGEEEDAYQAEEGY